MVNQTLLGLIALRGGIMASNNLLRRIYHTLAPAIRIAEQTTRPLFSDRYLLYTNTGITVFLSGTGDFLVQHYDIVQGRQDYWDPLRTLRLATSGVFIGPMCHYWYRFLDRVIPGRTIKAVSKKIFWDQLIFSPVNISTFFIVVGIIEGQSLKSLYQELKCKGPTLFKAELMIWPPAQLMNFAVVPLRFRVLFDNTVSLGFDWYYSHVKHNHPSGDESEDDNNEKFINEIHINVNESNQRKDNHSCTSDDKNNL
ncbi:unnamed protein product [Owenia fusiformis]|uniref:Mpv17-like protein 2 n=1 Tax=Owenia fusiformis TaxID=6347 RepID=A0A8S4NBZ1_OWEFU|nr:unnamed protein product [Owenia fusiformis]